MAAVNITKENIREVINGELPALIEFQAPWCTYCRRIASAFSAVAEQYAGELAVGQVDIDESPELALEYKVELVPTLMVFKNGQPAGSIVAPQSKAQIENFVNENL